MFAWIGDLFVRGQIPIKLKTAILILVSITLIGRRVIVCTQFFANHQTPATFPFQKT